VYGIGLGVVMSSVLWAANLAKSVPGTVYIFPDIITLIALPALVLLALRFLAFQDNTLTRWSLRRAGTTMVVFGALLFATTLTILGFVSFSEPSARMLLIGSTMAFAGFLGVGWLTVLMATSWFPYAHGRR